MPTNSKVKVIPCSGMGKVYGLLAREATLYTVNKLCQDKADTMCLAYIVTGDDAIKARINNQPCITVDGCPKLCAAKSVAAMGGDIKEEFKVMDVMKEHKGVLPGSATKLNPAGWTIVEEIAMKLNSCVQEICD